MTLFDEKGAGVTVSEITEAAGVSKGTFYVYFESKTELIAQLREVVIADHRLQMEKAITDNSPLGLNSDFSPEAVGVAIDFLSSELNSILFPTAAQLPTIEHSSDPVSLAYAVEHAYVLGGGAFAGDVEPGTYTVCAQGKCESAVIAPSGDALIDLR